MQQLTEEQRAQLEEKLKNMSPEELKEFQKKQCIFCQIVAGKVPSKKLFEDDSCIAILDVNPAARGHILLLPKEHYAIMPQLLDKELSHLFLISKSLSRMLLKVLKAEGTNVFVANGLAAGQRAQHFLIHIIPRKPGDALFNVDERLIDKEMVAKVKQAIEPKLNTVLGIKKDIVFTEQKAAVEQVKPKEQPSPKKIEPEKNTKKDKKKTADDKSVNPKSAGKQKENEDVSLDDIANLFTA